MPYQYQSPLRSKLSGLLRVVGGVAGAIGGNTVEDQAARDKFLMENPGVDPSIAPHYYKPESKFWDALSGGQGSRAAMNINADSMENYQRFLRSKALYDYQQQKDIEGIPLKSAAEEAAGYKVSARPNPFRTPGEVPQGYELGVEGGINPEDYTQRNARFDPRNSAGAALNAKTALERENAATQVQQNAGLIPSAENAENYNRATATPIIGDIRSKAVLNPSIRRAGLRGQELGNESQAMQNQLPQPLHEGFSVLPGSGNIVRVRSQPELSSTGLKEPGVTDASGRSVVSVFNLNEALGRKSINPSGSVTQSPTGQDYISSPVSAPVAKQKSTPQLRSKGPQQMPSSPQGANVVSSRPNIPVSREEQLRAKIAQLEQELSSQPWRLGLKDQLDKLYQQLLGE